MQYFPLVLALSFITLLLGVRGIRFHRRFGYSPFRLSHWRQQPANAILLGLMAAALAGVVVLAALAAIAPQQLAQLDRLHRAPGPGLLATGVLLVLVGAALALRGQQDMCEAWRVGIDPEERTRLVTLGLFEFCRNPIYLGLQVALMGFVALLPGFFSLTLLVTAVLLFQVQCRLEEAHLLRQHGAVYADYCRRVGRFLPWTGRRSLPVAESEWDTMKS